MGCEWAVNGPKSKVGAAGPGRRQRRELGGEDGAVGDGDPGHGGELRALRRGGRRVRALLRLVDGRLRRLEGNRSRGIRLAD